MVAFEDVGQGRGPCAEGIDAVVFVREDNGLEKDRKSMPSLEHLSSCHALYEDGYPASLVYHEEDEHSSRYP